MVTVWERDGGRARQGIQFVLCTDKDLLTGNPLISWEKTHSTA